MCLLILCLLKIIIFKHNAAILLQSVISVENNRTFCNPFEKSEDVTINTIKLIGR